MYLISICQYKDIQILSAAVVAGRDKDIIAAYSHISSLPRYMPIYTLVLWLCSPWLLTAVELCIASKMPRIPLF